MFGLYLQPQGYAWEITTAEGGYGLNGLLSGRKNVLNGTSLELCMSIL